MNRRAAAGYSLVLVLAASRGLAGEDRPHGPCPDATTQNGLTLCASEARLEADRDLEAMVQAVRAKHRDDPVFLEKLAAAQEAWRRFRDAELEAFYPHGADPGFYGSSFPSCWSGKATELTRRRTAELRVWITGTQEGEVCAGSVPSS